MWIWKKKNLKISFWQGFEPPPWRKFRIGINSEQIRTISNHSYIYIWANANQSEPIRKTVWILFVEKRLKINQTQSETSIWKNLKKIFNPNESESIRTRIDLNRIFNPNESEHWFIRIENQSVYGLIPIYSD